jgi:hypothetical protein
MARCERHSCVYLIPYGDHNFVKGGNYARKCRTKNRNDSFLAGRATDESISEVAAAAKQVPGKPWVPELRPVNHYDLLVAGIDVENGLVIDQIELVLSSIFQSRRPFDLVLPSDAQVQKYGRYMELPVPPTDEIEAAHREVNGVIYDALGAPITMSTMNYALVVAELLGTMREEVAATSHYPYPVRKLRFGSCKVARKDVFESPGHMLPKRLYEDARTIEPPKRQ